MSVPRATLGRSGIETGAIALGAWGFLTSTPPPRFRIEDEAVMREVFTTAFGAGMTLLDSAEVYGNEQALGKLLGEIGRPDDFVLSTKFGHGKGFTPEQIRDAVERSLAAFGLDTIPLFMLHDPRTAEDMAAIEGPGGALEELRRLQDEGKVGSIGIATGTLLPLQLAVESGHWDVIQFPRLYTLLNQGAEASGLLAAAKAKNIGTIMTSPFAGDILGTGVKAGGELLHGMWPAEPEVADAVRKMEEEADARGISLPQAAVAFSASHPDVDVVVLGVRTVEQLREDIAAFDAGISAEDLAAIAAAGAIDPYWVGGPEFVWSFPTERMPEVIKQALAKQGK